jgi:broad specificity phosphatase PhoE
VSADVEIRLVRHGEAASGWGEDRDPGLSPAGLAQAEASAMRLAPVVAACSLVSSPMARARETAEPLSRQLGMAVTVDPVFTEVPAPVPFERRIDWLREFMSGTWEQQPASVTEWRDAIIQRVLSLPTDAVVFTHFVVINAVVSHIRGESRVLCCRPDNGSITHLRRRDGVLQLLALGSERETHVG